MKTKKLLKGLDVSLNVNLLYVCNYFLPVAVSTLGSLPALFLTATSATFKVVRAHVSVLEHYISLPSTIYFPRKCLRIQELVDSRTHLISQTER